MEKGSNNTSTATLALSVFGLLAIISLGAIFFMGATMFVPPWLKVKCQRQEVLYYSTVVKDYESSFAGFHFLFGSSDWQTEKNGPTGPRSSGQIYDVTEYRVYWHGVFGEWIAIAIVAFSIFVVLSKRLAVGSFPVDDETVRYDEKSRGD